MLVGMVSLGATLVGCSGGGSATTGGIKTGGDFIVLQTEPSDNGALFLNDSIRIDFSNPVNLDSANLNTFSFEVRDQIGNLVTEPVGGNFVLERSPGDAAVGRRLSFVPRLPTNSSFTNGSFRPGRTYTVSLVGGDRVTGTVLRDAAGKGLRDAATFRFSTADGTSPGQLFRNGVAGGPRRTSLAITPTPDTNGVVLNKLGAPPLEIRLGFDQPLNPSAVNVPIGLDLNPLVRNESSRGRVFLEYDDADPALGANRWIPADVELESNSLAGATVLLRPVGVLPNNATVRVIVLETLEDISGESNVNNASYQRTFGTFETKPAYDQQFAGLVDDFLTASPVDFSAPFAEPFAEVGPGYVKAGFAFEGTPTNLEFEPEPVETILNTNFTQVTPKVGAAYNVSGGVFNFKNVTIGAGKAVRGQGSNPMVWLISGTLDVAGVLSVRGGNGKLVDSAGNANVPKDGGIGVCGGGDGGKGSPSAVIRDLAGQTGNGPSQVAGNGGLGGSLACTAGCVRGSGGGGGSLATQGDPNYKQKLVPVGSAPVPNPVPIFQQQVGIGGPGCGGAAGTLTRTLSGAAPGVTVFTDARADNNFWGSGLDRSRNLRITGELSVPVGGGGGGGGGDLSYNSNCNIDDVTFDNDSSGGGGGGGGGVLIVKALGPIVIRSTGSITADGGHGGGGEPSGSSGKGGGGGAGAGGMVVLMSATRIEINVRGTGTNFTYQQNNYDFSVSADGGICRTGTFGSPVVLNKYPASGVAVQSGTVYDAAPLGGLGGMGVVQLMTPPGTGTDGTNTIFDDNIIVLQNGVVQTGSAKRTLLAWRGYPNELGDGVDDSGALTNINDNEGDIRPAPILLPVPFASKSRLRSHWIDTGSTVRRPLLSDNDTPRGIITVTGDVPGPWYEFAGVDTTTGYAAYSVQSSLARVVYPAVGVANAIQSMNANSTFDGKPAYQVNLATPALGSVADRYSQYEAQLLNAANVVLGSFRILSHQSGSLFLSPESGALPATATKLQIRAKFFKVITGGQEGLGSTYLGASGDRIPTANVRIGFAFHQDPTKPTAQRFPSAPDTFAYDLSIEQVQQTLRLLGAGYVQWDILFDGEFRVDPINDNPPAFGPATPRPELHFLRLPFRF